MSKKDCEAIAKIISNYRSFSTNPLNLVEAALVDYFTKENSSFDKEKFYKACGRQ